MGLASGLDALWMAFRLLGIGPGDEVIVCANAYIACVMGITINGASPVFVEPDEYDNIDAGRIEAAVTPRTRAILAVHLFGQTCDMDEIGRIVQKYGLRLVEDCAQSHGTLFHGKQSGTFGDIGCFSFYPTKGLGAFGDGGAIVTDDEELAGRCRALRNYGSRVKYHNEVVGANSRLDELQAGLLHVKLGLSGRAQRGAPQDRRALSQWPEHGISRAAQSAAGRGKHVASVRHPQPVPRRAQGVAFGKRHRKRNPLSHPAASERSLPLPGLP